MTTREECAALACAPDPGPQTPHFPLHCAGSIFAPFCAAVRRIVRGGAACAGATKQIAYSSCLTPRDRFSHILTFSRPFFSRPLLTRRPKAPNPESPPSSDPQNCNPPSPVLAHFFLRHPPANTTLPALTIPRPTPI